MIWLGLIPGALMTVIGLVGINTDLVFLLWFSFALLVLGWPCSFLPLLGLGAYLRGRSTKRPSSADAEASFEPTPQPRIHH